jgi:glycerol-3-phosphate acyltransferase PlsY
MDALLPLAIAYAVGCVSFASIVARARGVDIRQHGSGNPGATNVGRVVGAGWGRLVLLLDVLKGFLPVLLLRLGSPLSVSPWLVDPEGRTLILAAAVAGHVLPVTSRFRGGKGVATLLGGLAALDWRLAAVAVVVHLLVRRTTGYVSVASVVLAWSAPLAQALGLSQGLDLPAGVAATACLALLVTLRHADNFGRIRAGREDRHRTEEAR